mmetsp:Transcript_37720/g.69793  ORF Transcript_37720/g.69793 Transcript_37720/m.69793 type:complete len:709 (-) Transcript_37720:162-2288(-)
MWVMVTHVLLLAFLVGASNSLHVQTTEELRDSYTFCIVGAGPGGIQLGQYLSTSQVAALNDYVIFERANSAGSFFRRYPVHRQLISINKRFFSEGHGEEYAFRQDWNSLIGRPEVRPMTSRSKAFYPHADTLADYLEDFSSSQVDAGRILFNTSVERVRRHTDGQLQLLIRNVHESSLRSVRCSHVVMANGLWTPKTHMRNLISGSEYLLGYDELPLWDNTDEAQAVWEDRFAGKDVAIIGLGNAAMEVAQALLPIAGSVHMFGRRSSIRKAHITHYVGDLRSHRTEIFDQFQLKMGSTIDDSLGYFRLMRCLKDKICFADGMEERLPFFREAEGREHIAPLLSLLREMTANGTLIEANLMDGEGDWHVQNSTDRQRQFVELMEHRNNKAELKRQKLAKDALLAPDLLSIKTKVLAEHSDLRDTFFKSRFVLSDRDNRDPFDFVIRCIGFVHNMTVYDPSAAPKLLKSRKHPDVTAEYESVNVPGLFFAGALGHGPDFRRSAGGFIHGFRYTTRALARIFQQRYGADWGGQQSFSLPGELSKLEEKVFWRVAESAGPYQMFDQLVEGIVFLPNGTALYLEEVPKQYYHKQFLHAPRIEWVFMYGSMNAQNARRNRVNFMDLDVDFVHSAHEDNFLHPVFRYFPPGSLEMKDQVHVHADFFTRWRGAARHEAVMRRYLHMGIKRAYKHAGGRMAEWSHEKECDSEVKTV